jgi:hypothetical protein
MHRRVNEDHSLANSDMNRLQGRWRIWVQEKETAPVRGD